MANLPLTLPLLQNLLHFQSSPIWLNKNCILPISPIENCCVILDSTHALASSLPANSISSTFKIYSDLYCDPPHTAPSPKNKSSSLPTYLMSISSTCTSFSFVNTTARVILYSPRRVRHPPAGSPAKARINYKAEPKVLTWSARPRPTYPPPLRPHLLPHSTRSSSFWPHQPLYAPSMPLPQGPTGLAIGRCLRGFPPISGLCPYAT